MIHRIRWAAGEGVDVLLLELGRMRAGLPNCTPQARAKTRVIPGLRRERDLDTSVLAAGSLSRHGHLGAALITGNPRDFEGLEGFVEVVAN